MCRKLIISRLEKILKSTVIELNNFSNEDIASIKTEKYKDRINEIINKFNSNIAASGISSIYSLSSVFSYDSEKLKDEKRKIRNIVKDLKLYTDMLIRVIKRKEK